MTPLQERKLNQFKDEVALLEKQLQKINPLYIIRLAWIVTLSYFIISMLYDLVIEKKSIDIFLQEYSWKKILFDFIFWLVLGYFFILKGTAGMLKLRRKEMEAYEKKLAKEAAS